MDTAVYLMTPEQVKAAFRRIDEQKEVTETVHRPAVTKEFMAKKQSRQATELEDLKSKPAKRWEDDKPPDQG